VPQVVNAHRFHCSVAHVPRVVAIYERCMALPAFARAAPPAPP
jgi:maleylacetoacetate isomerase/maleylpyruvate isomerase